MRNVVHAKDVAESSFALDFSSASYCNLTLYILGHLFNPYYLDYSRQYKGQHQYRQETSASDRLADH